MNNSHRSQFMLIATIILLALTGLMIARNEELVFRDEGRLVMELDPSDPGTVIFYWRSDVETPMARRFADGYVEWKGKIDRIVIDLHSPGGAIREGEAVIREIERMKRTHIVDTRVRSRRACYSMCVPIFLQGETRSAAPNARFMFHQPTSYDYFTGERVDEPEWEREMAAQKFFRRYFVDSPITPAWRDKLALEWRGKDVFRSAQELVDERSNIVTDLE